jgi:hypothetical protein
VGLHPVAFLAFLIHALLTFVQSTFSIMLSRFRIEHQGQDAVLDFTDRGLRVAGRLQIYFAGTQCPTENNMSIYRKGTRCFRSSNQLRTTRISRTGAVSDSVRVESKIRTNWEPSGVTS